MARWPCKSLLVFAAICHRHIQTGHEYLHSLSLLIHVSWLIKLIEEMEEYPASRTKAEIRQNRYKGVGGDCICAYVGRGKGANRKPTAHQKANYPNFPAMMISGSKHSGQT